MNLFGILNTLASNLLNQSLIYSVSYNNIFLAKCFIRCGANVNIYTLNEFGFSPLDIAVRLGYQQMAGLLLNNGADVNSQDTQDHPPLHIAAVYDNQEMVELLLNNGANINTLDEFGSSPLDISVGQGNQEIVKLLLNNGADVNPQDKQGNTPLHIAVKQDNQSICQLLLSKDAIPTLHNKQGNTPLHIAVEKGNQEIVKLLLNNGALPILKNKQGNAPLHIAVEKGNQSIVKLLRKAIKPYSFTALHSAVIFCDTEQVKKLLAENANVDAQDAEGKTPLHHAAEELGRHTVAKLLLNANANTEIKDSLGQTPLLMAGNPEIFTLLLDYSADWSVVTSAIDKGVGTCWYSFNVPFVLGRYQNEYAQNVKIPTIEFHENSAQLNYDLNANNGDNVLYLTGA